MLEEALQKEDEALGYQRKLRAMGLVCSALLIAAHAGASESDLANQVRELKETVKALEQRVQKLEDAKALPTDSSQGHSTNAWRNLKIGMPRADVVSILGEPGQISKDKTSETWYFPDPPHGYVIFDSSGVVTSWEEPMTN